MSEAAFASASPRQGRECEIIKALSGVDEEPGRGERIVEIVAREVLIALAEQEMESGHVHGDHCTTECSEGLCVQTCYDRVGQVVSAGAHRLTASLGVIPPEKQLAAMIPGCPGSRRVLGESGGMEGSMPVFREVGVMPRVVSFGDP